MFIRITMKLAIAIVLLSHIAVSYAETSDILLNCSSLSMFHDECIYPVLESVNSNMEIEEICEVAVWGIGKYSHAHFKDKHCPERSLSIFDTPLSLLDECRHNMTEERYESMITFYLSCAGHVTELDQYVLNENNGNMQSFSSQSDLRVVRKEIDTGSYKLNNVRHVNISEIQVLKRDILHTLWLNGPTYSEKLERNRLAAASGAWPAFSNTQSDEYFPLFLRGANGHCVTYSSSSLQIAQCYTLAVGIYLKFDNTYEGSIFTEDEEYLCVVNDPINAKHGDLLEISSTECLNSYFIQNVDSGTIVHNQSNLCLAPYDETSSFGASDTTPLMLSQNCSLWSFGFWSQWQYPPGYSDGFEISSSAAVSGSYDPPRWYFRLATPCEAFRTYISNYDGSYVTNMSATRSSDGERYQHNINYVEHVGWPSGSNCLFFFRPYNYDSVGDYNADWLTEWNAFFSVGDSLILGRGDVNDVDDDSVIASTICDASRSKYSGYSSTGALSYCQPSSSKLDIKPYLLIHSGWLGVVVDASMKHGNLLPKFGLITDENCDNSSQHIFNTLTHSNLNISLVIYNETENSYDTFSLTKTLDFATVSPIRQGQAVTHVLITNLGWKKVNDRNVVYESDYLDPPQWWLEINMWGNSVSLQLGWQELETTDDCAICFDADITFNLTVDNRHTFIRTAQFHAGDDAINTLDFFFEDLRSLNKSHTLASSELQNDEVYSDSISTSTSSSSIIVTSNSGTVVKRNETADIVLEVESTMERCSYGVVCSPLPIIDFTAYNNQSSDQMLRLIVSRNFPLRYSIDQLRPLAEVTGISCVLRDQYGQATGVKMQISKKWQSPSARQNYEAGYGDTTSTWWTINILMRIPANSQFIGNLNFIYNRYGNVPSYSHNQLSISGYSDAWVWHEASLASLGENFCFDVLGIHTRAQITDMRVELFDGVWAENVGGGEFLVRDRVKDRI